jgi:protein-disulfide isomerase
VTAMFRPMFRPWSRPFLLSLAAILSLVTHSEAQSTGVAAVVGDTAVTVSELEEAAQGRLLQLRSQEYDLEQQVLEETIARLLIEREAKARGVSTEELIRQEVESKVPPITEAEAKAAWDLSAERPSGERESLAQIATSLRQKRIDDRRQEFVDSLRDKANIHVLLDPPRIRLRNGDAPVKGPEHAPITIVEFSEFQCSYCGRVTSTLKQLQAEYGDRLQIVFRHFPLPSHKDAPKASEAALCAGEQRKFWEMHDRLFANQGHLQIPDLKQRAADLLLDTAKFDACLDSGRYASRVQADVADGSRYGVTGTPAFFINGRPLVGAVPYESFARLIDDELARAARPPSGAPSP